MKLTEEHKAMIVTSYACYMTPMQIVRAFRERFDIADDPNKSLYKQIRDWGPHGKTGCRAGKWRELFDTTRQRFLAEMGEIPIANQATRLRYLNEIVEAALEKNNPRIALEAMEQAAKEMGNAFTNRRELAGTVEHTVTDTRDMSIDERRNMLADKLSEALLRSKSATVVAGNTTTQ